MRVDRSALGWGVALITGGAVLLLRNLDVLSPEVSVWAPAMLAAGVVLLAHGAGRRGAGDLAVPAVLAVVGGLFVARDLGGLPTVPLLPVALIVAGVLVLAAALPRRRAGRGYPSEAVVETLGSAQEGRLALHYGAGNLAVGDGASPGRLFEGVFVAGVDREVERRGRRVDATLRHPPEVWRVARSRHALDWDLSLPSDVPLDVEVKAGAARITLDLSNVAARNLVLQTGASDVDVTVPARGRCRARITAGAADVRVHVPEGVAAFIRNRSALAGVDIDHERFPAVPGGFRSPDYDSAQDRVDIDIDGGVASFSVR